MSALHDTISYQTHWTIRKYLDDDAYARGEAYDQVDIDGNMLLNEGIQTLLDLAIGAAATPYNNANAQLGVGDSSAAEDANQTDLQATTNKTWKGMETGYPTRSGQTLTFRSVFGPGDANYAWNEFSVRNGAADKNLNRKVSAQGTKASGQTWTLDMSITLS